MYSASSYTDMPPDRIKGALDKALIAFHNLFLKFENEGLIVREFPQANSKNIWIFGYLLDSVRDAPAGEKFEKRVFNHERLLTAIEKHLSAEGNMIGAEMISSRFLTNSLKGLTDSEIHDRFSVANKRRFLNFSLGVLLEMHNKGVVADNDLVQNFRNVHDNAVNAGEVSTCLLDVPALIDDIIKEFHDKGIEGSDLVFRYKNWTQY